MLCSIYSLYRVIGCFLWSGLIVVAGAANSFASLVSLGPMTLSANIGTFPTTLTIQNAGTVSGCVAFIGGTDITGTAACPGGFTGSGGNEIGTSQETGTRTIAELNAAGISTSSNLLFVFHPAEPGAGPITIQDLALTFFNVATDNTFTTTLAGTPIQLASTQAGSAANAGFAFGLDAFQAGLASEFFAIANNRVGGAATLANSAGGTATFVLAPRETAPPPSGIPEPNTMSLAALGCLGMSAYWGRRRET